jgi:hypothetical protein
MTALLAALQASRVSIVMVESLRIIDPVLYPLTVDGNSWKRHRLFCPSLPKFARGGPWRKEGGFDWI